MRNCRIKSGPRYLEAPKPATLADTGCDTAVGTSKQACGCSPTGCAGADTTEKGRD